MKKIMILSLVLLFACTKKQNNPSSSTQQKQSIDSTSSSITFSNGPSVFNGLHYCTQHQDSISYADSNGTNDIAMSTGLFLLQYPGFKLGTAYQNQWDTGSHNMAFISTIWDVCDYINSSAASNYTMNDSANYVSITLTQFGKTGGYVKGTFKGLEGVTNNTTAVTYQMNFTGTFCVKRNW